MPISAENDPVVPTANVTVPPVPASAPASAVPPAGSLTWKPAGIATVTVCVSDPSVKSPKVAPTFTVPDSPAWTGPPASPLSSPAPDTATGSATASTGIGASTVVLADAAPSTAVAEICTLFRSTSLSGGGVKRNVPLKDVSAAPAL